MPCFVAKRYILQQVFKEVNRKLPARNMMVQLLTLYTNPDSHNAHVTDKQTDRQTDNIMMPIANNTVQKCRTTIS